LTPLTQLAQLLSSGAVTPQQLADAFGGRLRRYEPLLHPVVTFTDALARRQAAAAQQALAAGAAVGAGAGASAASSAPCGPSARSAHSLLLGMPYGLKDLAAVPGYPTTWGLWGLRNRTIDAVRMQQTAARAQRAPLCMQARLAIHTPTPRQCHAHTNHTHTHAAVLGIQRAVRRCGRAAAGQDGHWGAGLG
jgi:Asp-tRNA(Asn)/Glu-tRNA(Gln) amidotransferase A subunit family amidase